MQTRTHAPAPARRRRWLAILASALPLLGLSTQAQSTLTNGLTAYWSFDGNYWDSVKNFHGTPVGTNAQAFVDGKAGFGKALVLDGTDQYVDITGGDSGNNLVFVGGSVSVAGWFTVGAFDKSWQALVAKGEGSSWRVARNSAGTSMSYTGGLTDTLGTADVTDGNWHHFVAITDKAATAWGTALYVDGVLEGTQGDSTAPPALTQNSTAHVMIGENPDAKGRQWNGKIDDIGIWNRVLTETEIAALYSNGAGKALSSFLPPVPAGNLVITTQPQSVSVSANSTVAFTVVATTTGSPPPVYQWLKNGTAIGGATSASYTTPLVTLADTGAKYTVKVSVPGADVLSDAATLTVTQDSTPPTITGITTDQSFTTVGVQFSEPVTDSALTKGNYAINSGVTVSSVARVNASKVNLTTSKMAEGAQLTLTVNNVQDTATPANTIQANTVVNFQAAVFAIGWATYQRWDNENGSDLAIADFATAIADGTIRAPDLTTAVSQFGGPWGLRDNYSSRTSGYFTPATSGSYVFFVASDDQSNLYLSTDDTPANKKLIAQEVGWSNQYQWTVPGSGAPEEKRSDTCSASEWPTPNVITLTAGKRYYLEILQDEGGGGDGEDATFIMAGDADPAQDATGMKLKGNLIGTYLDPNGSSVTFTKQPVNTQGVDGKTATFTAVATGVSPYGGTPSYQWQKNGTDIAGANKANYTTPALTLADSGTKYKVIASVPTKQATSDEVTLTVVADTFAPVPSVNAILRAAGTYDVGVSFDEAVDAAAGTQANYTLSGGTVTTFTYYPKSPGVVLTASGLTPGTKSRVTVKNVADLKGNKITTATVEFTVGKMAWGVVGGDRLKLGNGIVTVGDNGFDIYSDGATEWNNYDEATFVYEQITGDFDKKLRVEYQDSSSQWARAGLIVRDVTNFGVIDTEQAGSNAVDSNAVFDTYDGKACRYQKVHVNPVVTAMGTAGNNSWEGNRRLATGGPSSSAGGGGTPLYPNAWCRLSRVGDLFTIYRSDDGENWTQLGTTTFPDPMPATLYVGPDFSPENGNVTDETLRGVWLAKIRDYGDTAGGTTPGGPSLSVSNAGGKVTITYAGGTLQSTPQVGTGAVWTAVTGATSPYTVNTSGAATLFYRVAQ